MEQVSCDLKYSGQALVFLCAAVGSTLALVVLAPFPDIARALLFAYVVTAATAAHRSLSSARALCVDCRRSISVRDAGGQWRSGHVRDGCFVSPWLTLVRWRPEGAWLDRSLVVLPDMLAADEMRRLRVILRWS